MGKAKKVKYVKPRMTAGQKAAEAQLLALTRGEGGPTLAQQQLQQGVEAGARQGVAVANSARGAAAPGLAARAAVQQAGQTAAQAAGQSSMLRAQEIANAQQALIGSGLQQQQTMAGLEAARIGAQQQADDSRRNLIGKIAGGLISGGAGALGALSDEDEKTDVKSGDKKIQAFLDALEAHDYVYKGKNDDGKRHMSPMAQEFEASEVGEGMVEDTPNGKMVDYGAGFGAMMAAAAQMNKRIKALEGKGGSKKMADGGMVPGKPKVKGDSVKNDTVNIKASPGEIIVPRSVAKKSPKEIASFVANLQRKKVRSR